MDEFLSSEWYKEKRIRNGKIAVYILKTPKNSRLPRMTLSQTPDYLWHLTIEVSFSAWCRGSNIQLCDELEIHSFLQLLPDYVFQKCRLKFDAFKAKVIRIDVVDDMFVGEENLFRIIKDITRNKPKLFDRTNINDETIYFKNTGQKENTCIIFYDKYKQSCKEYPNAEDLELARGILRLEVRLRNKQIDRIVKQLSLIDRSSESLLNERVAEHILNNAKKIIRFDLRRDQETDWIFDIATRLPIVKAILIIGFVLLLRKFGDDFYKIAVFDFNKRTYQRYIKKCFDAGINPFE